jgi:hydrogenase maturation protein HypF
VKDFKKNLSGKNGISYNTKKLFIWGIVQGVGFRPFVFRCAKKNNIAGTVRNIGGLVEIIAQATEQDFTTFLKDLQADGFGNWEIVKIKVEELKDGKYSDFEIINSGMIDETSIIPPDLCVCQKCQDELQNFSDRRFQNPFISCMSCGPRYSIIEQLPYDRHNTTMMDFEMCEECKQDYTDPESRRFHAQTISCNHCGPYLIFKSLDNESIMKDDFSQVTAIPNDTQAFDGLGNEKTPNKALKHIFKMNLINEDAFNEAIKIINSGGIVAIKGIGGYLYACSPFDAKTVQNLRQLKGREEKPFAVMFESVESVCEYCYVSKEEEKLLKSKANPIVLLIAKESKFAYSTNKGSIYCGAFIPYTPLQMMLLKSCGPLIMTSANSSNKPIIKDDLELLSLKSPFLDGVLYNKRRIVRSVDDSVAKMIDGHPQLIRRSRGYVPYPIFLPQSDLQIFSAGGDLKSAFCLYKNQSAVVSQHLGDLEEYSVMELYEDTVSNLCHLLKIKPDIAICDLHPNYFSSKFAKTLNIPILYVQHHHAHIASVMAEHSLKGKVIGVAFDGTGYGTDGNIWGGEFLVCEGAEFKRVAHLAYTPILGGDSSMKDAQKTATCFLLELELENYIDDTRKDIIKSAINSKINTVLSSSMGRLFDAVSAILEIKKENSYEGECAAHLEKQAILAKRNGVAPTKLSFGIEKKVEHQTELNVDIGANEIVIANPKPLLEELCKLKATADTGSLALGFHYAVADLILNICNIIRAKQNINTVALSGGVFQNTVLTERTLELLIANDFDVHYNRSVPPNDGGISLGQTYIGLMRE